MPNCLLNLTERFPRAADWEEARARRRLRLVEAARVPAAIREGTGWKSSASPATNRGMAGAAEIGAVGGEHAGPPAGQPAGQSAAPAEGDEAIRGWAHEGLNFPTFRLTLLAKVIDRLTLRTLGECCDLTIAEWRVLSRLAPVAGATVRQVAQMAWVDRAETSRAASALEARGLIGRRDNPGDRRAPILFATAEGRREYDRLLPIRAEFHHALTEEMSQADRDAFDRLLALVARKLGKLADE